MADDNEGRPEVTKTADLYGRHKSDPAKWDEAGAVTGRPVDAVPENSTLASRAAKAKPAAKQVEADEVENKAVTAAPAKKAPARKAPAKKASKG